MEANPTLDRDAARHEMQRAAVSLGVKMSVLWAGLGLLAVFGLAGGMFLPFPSIATLGIGAVLGAWLMAKWLTRYLTPARPSRSVGIGIGIAISAALAACTFNLFVHLLVLLFTQDLYDVQFAMPLTMFSFSLLGGLIVAMVGGGLYGVLLRRLVGQYAARLGEDRPARSDAAAAVPSYRPVDLSAGERHRDAAALRDETVWHATFLAGGIGGLTGISSAGLLVVGAFFMGWPNTMAFSIMLGPGFASAAVAHWFGRYYSRETMVRTAVLAILVPVIALFVTAGLAAMQSTIYPLDAFGDLGMNWETEAWDLSVGERAGRVFETTLVLGGITAAIPTLLYTVLQLVMLPKPSIRANRPADEAPAE